VVPGILCHEELPAMPGVVVAVRTHFVADFARLSIGARAWLGQVLVIAGTGPEDGQCDLNEIAPIEWAFADGVPDHLGRVHGAREFRVEPDWHQRHLALGTLARLVVQHVFVARHRAHV
jgi:hypothetical protein